MNYEDIKKIVLDPNTDDELREQAFIRIKQASNGKINDFSIGSPIAALVEGQVYAMAELFWYLNQLPEAIALETFRLAGIQRSLGTKASGSVVVQLSGILRDNFIINKGYQIAYKDGWFTTVEQLVIPPGAISGNVTIEAKDIGEYYNVPPYGLTVANPGMAYVQSIYNIEPLTGGTDLEPLNETVLRAQLSLRSRDVLVSQEDFEQAAQDFLGAGSRASCVPLLSSDKETKQPGQVHIFLVDANGDPPAIATCNLVQTELQNRSFAASSVWVSPVVLEPVTVELIANTNQISPELAQSCYDALVAYTHPAKTFPLGGSLFINELEYVFRNVPGITLVTSVLIDGSPLNRAMPLLYSTPTVDTLSVTLVQPDKTHKTYYLGTGEGDVE